MDRTLLIIKPDAYEKGLEGVILDRIRSAGLEIARFRKRRLSRAEVERLYAEHRGKPFFRANMDFILSGPVGLLMLRGKGDVVKRVRKLVGNKDPALAEPGSIRGDFGIDPDHIERNLVHASSDESAAWRELMIFFKEEMVGRKAKRESR